LANNDIGGYMGDCDWSGQTYNGITTSRADFFANVYKVSPTVAPCTWAVITNR
jgi:hypothetical protein